MRHGWTLDRSLWTELREMMSDLSWRHARCSILEKGHIPKSGGVYVFCARPGHPIGLRRQRARRLLEYLINAVYVGQATSLRSRFTRHCEDPMRPMAKVRSCFGLTMEFWFVRIPEQDRRNQLESLLIECLGPIANRQAGPSTFPGRVGTGRPA